MLLIKEREENGEFKSIYDFCKRIDTKATNKRVLEGLIKSGAFSNLEKSRKQLLENLEYIVNTANREAKAKEEKPIDVVTTEDTAEATDVTAEVVADVAVPVAVLLTQE